ncbi:hypothetical protein OG21DRAFT_1474406 [Imleria badia]|nr:hypothetical protein OG21DRAFT_1474406 [Imleria badia]
MFSSIHAMIPSDADIANQTLKEESNYRFSSFSATDAVTLGLSLRKRFRGSSRHVKGKGMVISIQTIAGHTLFACTAGDLGHHSGEGDVSLDSWACLESMVSVVKRTSHSSYYVEKGMSAMGKTAKQMGVEGEFAIRGGAFPIWLDVSMTSRDALMPTQFKSTERSVLPYCRGSLLLGLKSGRP